VKLEVGSSESSRHEALSFRSQSIGMMMMLQGDTHDTPSSAQVHRHMSAECLRFFVVTNEGGDHRRASVLCTDIQKRERSTP